MISAIITAKDQERPLARTLTGLVPATIEGLVREAIVVDGGSSDGTAVVADAAGCKVVNAAGGLAAGLRRAAGEAHGPWLLFLPAGVILDVSWARHATDFIDDVNLSGKGASSAALFRGQAAGWKPLIADSLASVGRLAGLLPPSGSGLLVSQVFYATLGGHADPAADFGRDLTRRIGKRRLTLLKLPSIRTAS